jgi:hypothetical protein
MSAIRQIDTGELVYSVVDDFTSVYRAVIIGVVTDEIFGALSASDITVEVDRKDLDTKTTKGGAFAVTGYTSATSYTANLVIRAPGFSDFKVAVPVAANAISPATAPPIALRRALVRVQGRVVADTASRAPIAGAKVVAVDDPTSPPPATHILNLRSTLSLAHASGKTVREIAMTSSGSATLNTDALAGAKIVALSTTTGLLAGSVIRFANATGTQVVYAVAASVAAGSAGLRDPLNTSFFAAGTSVQFLNPGAPGLGGVLNGDADAGDGVLLSSAALAGNTLEIEPGSASVEYCETGALTDADGYYAINGVGRSAEIFFEASHSGFTNKISPWMVEFDNAVNVLDFRL